jgi:hypothetical protein
MMLRPEVRKSVIAACIAGSITSTTPPHLRFGWSQAEIAHQFGKLFQFGEIGRLVGFREFRDQQRLGSPFTTASMVGRNMAMSRPSATMVLSTSSTISFSFTRCWVASIAS